MKKIKRQLYLVTILLFSLFLLGIPVLVTAATDKPKTYINQKYYTLQCIYADGSLFTRTINMAMSDFTNNKWLFTQSRYNYSLFGATQNNVNSSNPVIVNPITYPLRSNEDHKDSRNYVQTCRNYVINTYVDFGGDIGVRSYYKFVHSDKDEIYQNDITGVNKDSSWDSLYIGSQDIEWAKVEDARKYKKYYKNVSESFILAPNAPQPDRIYYYVQKAEQASGTDQYIKIMIYQNVVFLQSKSLTTQVRIGEGAEFFVYDTEASTYKDGSTEYIDNDAAYLYDGYRTAPNIIYINSPEPIPIESEGSKVSYTYKENNKRYWLSASPKKPDMYGNATCKDCINKYVLTDDIDENYFRDDGDLCKTIMPNTANVLRIIIRYSQFLVPVLLIVLIALDLGKIVLAGNLDEELPKQKKKIMSRVIVAITFFFLPIIINLILTLVRDSGGKWTENIEFIGCLFDVEPIESTEKENNIDEDKEKEDDDEETYEEEVDTQKDPNDKSDYLCDECAGG